LEPGERQALDALDDADAEGAGLGFRKKREAISPGEIKRKLSEQGVAVSEASAERLALRRKADGAAATRQRFWMQVVISLIVLIVALATIVAGHPAAATEKAMFGLVGTVLGYWLR
jgi:hypothetical protein